MSRPAFATVLASLAALAACAATPVGEGTHRVQSFDGLEIVFDVAGGGDPTLVLVHGWRCHRGHWGGQVAELARGTRVVTLDLGGHGDSGAGRED